MTTAAPNNNLVAGIVAAVLGALAGAVLWAVVVSVTDYKIGFAAVGVGALTGLLAGRAGGGHPRLPAIAAAIGVLGCVAGDFLIDAHLVATANSVSSVSVITEHTSFLWSAYKYDFDVLTGAFYLFAGVAAFRLATQLGAQQAITSAPQAWPAPVGEPALIAPPVPTPAPSALPADEQTRPTGG